MMRFVALILIKFYQYCLSPVLGPSCRYTPTCSQYAYSCIERFGFYRGSILSFRRLCRCHPWGGSGYDPPPTRESCKSFGRPKFPYAVLARPKKENR